MTTLLRIVAPHFVAGLLLDSNLVVTKAAPIVRYMVGWTDARVAQYAESKRWRVEVTAAPPSRRGTPPPPR